MRFLIQVVAYIGAMIGGVPAALALESRAFTRDAIIDYHFGGDGRTAVRSEEIYSFLDRVPAGNLKLSEFLQTAPGRIPDRLVVQLIRAGERTQLQSTIRNATLEINHPALLRGDVVHLSADYAPQPSATAQPFMVARAFSPHERWTEARVAFSGPGLRRMGLAVNGFQRISTNARDDEQQVWVFRAGAPDLPEAHAVNAFEFAARFSLSEAVSWQELGRSYSAAFEVQPPQSGALRQLARQITPEIASNPAKAAAIAAFLAREFQIEDDVNGVVLLPPPAVEQLAEQRKGSRLDAARLAKALLSVESIDAELVLTNRRALFTRPAVPIAAFDTAFLVLPSLGKVLNPVARSDLQDNVPSEFAGKFALRLASNGSVPITIEMPDSHADSIRIVAELSLSPKGQLSGLTRTEASGASGVMLENHIEGLARLSHDELTRRLLTLQNLEGSIELLPQPSKAEGLRNAAKTVAEHSFTLQPQHYRQNTLRLPLFAGPRLIRPPQNPYLAAIQQGAQQPIACRPQRFEQEIVIHLPYARAIPALKNDQRVDLPHASYHAEYRLETAQRLHIKRQLVISPPAPTCSKAFIDEIAPVIRAAARDMERAVSISAEGL